MPPLSRLIPWPRHGLCYWYKYPFSSIVLIYDMSISYLISCFRLLLLNNISKNFSSLITFSLFKINLFQRTTQHITITSICLANVHFFSTVTNKPWSAIYQYNEVFRISLGDTWFIYFFLIRSQFDHMLGHFSRVSFKTLSPRCLDCEKELFVKWEGILQGNLWTGPVKVTNSTFSRLCHYSLFIVIHKLSEHCNGWFYWPIYSFLVQNATNNCKMQ